MEGMRQTEDPSITIDIRERTNVPSEKSIESVIKEGPDSGDAITLRDRREELWILIDSEAATVASGNRQRRERPPEASPMKKREDVGEEKGPAGVQDERGRRTVRDLERMSEGNTRKEVSLLLPGRPERTAKVLSGKDETQNCSDILENGEKRKKKGWKKGKNHSIWFWN